jgi:hypothetical protein
MQTKAKRVDEKFLKTADGRGRTQKAGRKGKNQTRRTIRRKKKQIVY